MLLRHYHAKLNLLCSFDQFKIEMKWIHCTEAEWINYMKMLFMNLFQILLITSIWRMISFGIDLFFGIHFTFILNNIVQNWHMKISKILPLGQNSFNYLSAMCLVVFHENDDCLNVGKKPIRQTKKKYNKKLPTHKIENQFRLWLAVDGSIIILLGEYFQAICFPTAFFLPL